MTDFFEIVKDITKAHAAAQGVTLTRYKPYHISGADWATEGPEFDTRAEAHAWLDREIKHDYRKDSWGYINEINA